MEMPNVQLSGFRDCVEEQVIDAVNELINKRLHDITHNSKKINEVHFTLKPIHKREKGEIYEVHLRVFDNGKRFVAEFEDRNLLAAVDEVIERVSKEMSKQHR